MDQSTVRDFLRLAERPAPSLWRGGDAVVAGGTWLMSEPQPGVRRLVDITGLGWPSLVITDDGLEIAATCTIADLAAAAGDPAPLLRGDGRTDPGSPVGAGVELPDTWTVAPLVRRCADSLVASFKIWHLATVGGNVCLGLPAGSMISLLTALDATALVWRADGAEERMPVADLVTGPGRTALGPADLLRSFTIGATALTSRTAFARMSLSARGRSAAIVIARQDHDGSVTVSITAATNRPYVLTFTEPPPPQRYVETAAHVIGDDYTDDVHGAPDWRRHLVRVLGVEVLTALTRKGPA
ncbi:FAD binding domain-containing protein [Phytoactinopolyspora endophytica]|uniref:FAD binding domain-containing protein n=1 Tax=Phytoactinopolyspora endophytica TaxID=1642495 RepID=UPI00101BDC36|nr:FAD binding domain-containing protein [Phytoactinopolyspora endophytica]